MSDMFTLVIIIIVDFISIVLGLYSGFVVVKAFLDGKDIGKYQGYVITAFLLIIAFPLIFTPIGLKFGDYISLKESPIGVNFKINDMRSVNGKLSLSSNSQIVSSYDNNIINLKVFNDDKIDKDFSIGIHCLNSKENCDKAIDTILPKEEKFSIKKKVNFIMPISINLKDDVPSGDYKFNITVKDENDKIYDSIPLVISVKEN